MKELDSVPDALVSALMDGEVTGAERAQTLSALLSSPAAQKQWHAYHVAGDVMRSADLAPTPSELEFLERLQSRLAVEPNLRTPGSAGQFPEQAFGAPAVVRPTAQSANARMPQWAAVSGVLGFGVCAVVAVVLWSGALGDGSDPLSGVASVGLPAVTGSGTGTAQSGGKPGGALTAPDTTSLAGKDPQVMLRDPELDALLSAHRAMGGNSALQLPSGFLRNATFERPNP